MCILKEGKQAFGLMVANSVNTEAAFKYPITTIPLAIASTDGGLRQSDTAQLRIFPTGTHDIFAQGCATLWSLHRPFLEFLQKVGPL